MTKITYIISDIDKALAFEWLAIYLNKDLFQLNFILLNPGPSQLHDFLETNRFKVRTICCASKKDWPSALIKTIDVLRATKPDVVHCHLLQANIIGLTAAKVVGVRKRIYTRHHSSLHHIYHKKGLWWDKLANKLATHIIAISDIVKEILVKWEGASPEKVYLIPHGFLLDEFRNVSAERFTAIKERIEITGAFPVVGVISRFTEWKGVQFIIPAFLKLSKSYPQGLLLLFNAQGDFEKTILESLQELPTKNYRLLTFEKDIAAAYKVMDLFVHTPIDNHSEAFGQTYVEALASGVPSVFTRSGIANDAELFNDSSAIIVEHKNSEQIFEAMKTILGDKALTKKRIEAGKKMTTRFELDLFIKKLEKLYQ